MRRILFRMGAIAVIVAGAMSLQADPAACNGEGCFECGYECLTFDDCIDDMGAQWYHYCECYLGYCITTNKFDCEPD